MRGELLLTKAGKPVLRPIALCRLFSNSFRVISDVDQNHAGEAMQEILKELTTIRTQPVSENELNDAKRLLNGNFGDIG